MAKTKTTESTNEEISEVAALEENQQIDESAIEAESTNEDVDLQDDGQELQHDDLDDEEADDDETDSDDDLLEGEILIECLKNTSIPNKELVKGQTYIVNRDAVLKLLKHKMVKEID